MNLIQIIIEKKLNGTVHFGPNPARPKSKIGDSSWRIGWRRRRWGRRPRSKLGGSESILGGWREDGSPERVLPRRHMVGRRGHRWGTGPVGVGTGGGVMYHRGVMVELRVVPTWPKDDQRGAVCGRLFFSAETDGSRAPPSASANNFLEDGNMARGGGRCSRLVAMVAASSVVPGGAERRGAEHKQRWDEERRGKRASSLH
jgi:hypothetical protein